MHKTLKKLNQGNSEIKASNNNQRLYKFCRYGEFCQHFQRLLKPMCDLTRKGRQFIWEEEQ